jgi:uncharacterized protein YrzB (UPF0473 family)
MSATQFLVLSKIHNPAEMNEQNCICITQQDVEKQLFHVILKLSQYNSNSLLFFLIPASETNSANGQQNDQ